MKPIPYGRQNITRDDVEAVSDALLSDFLTQGPKVAEFERDFAEYVGAEYAVAVSNGTAALHLCAMALGVKEGDGVITTPVTFAASANGFRYCGAEISFCDIDPDTYLIDLEKLEKMLAEAPKGTYKGVVAVDFAGYPVNMERLREIADRYGLWIVEDACHSPGGYFFDTRGDKQMCGNGRYADLTVFSFHPVKHIATGEGGAVTTNDKGLYDKISLLRTHGITKDPAIMAENHGGWYYEMVELGYNYRLTDMQAALGISQLKRAEAGLARRTEIAGRYNTAFSGNAYIKTPYTGEGVFHARHLYVIEVPDRKGLYDHLREQGIMAQVHYIPLHTMPYYRALERKSVSMPVSESYYSRCLSLPMYPSLTDEEQQKVITEVLAFYK